VERCVTSQTTVAQETKTYPAHRKASHRLILILPCASVSKRVLVPNLSYESEIDLHENEPVGGTHFHMKGFARRFFLTQRHQVTRKWPIAFVFVKSTQILLHNDKFREKFHAFISLIIEEIRIIGDSAPLMGASMCIFVEGLLVSDASSSIALFMQKFVK